MSSIVPDAKINFECILYKLQCAPTDKIHNQDVVVWFTDVKRICNELLVTIYSNHRVAEKTRLNVCAMIVNSIYVILWFVETAEQFKGK